MYNKLKQILYLVILFLAPLTNNPSSAPSGSFYVYDLKKKYFIKNIFG
jgi:hypothetical protein